MNDGNAATGNTSAEIQLVVFDLATESYGIDISSAREIIRMQEITQVPGTPDFVEGVINLRGKVIPVLDLRKRLDRAVGEQTEDTRIVVVAIGRQDIGVIVDAVTEVLRISNDLVGPLPTMTTSINADYLRGIAKLEGRLIILLDLDKVLSQDERSTLVDDIRAPQSRQEKSAGTGKKRTVSVSAAAAPHVEEERSIPSDVAPQAEEEGSSSFTFKNESKSARELAGARSR